MSSFSRVFSFLVLVSVVCVFRSYFIVASILDNFQDGLPLSNPVSCTASLEVLIPLFTHVEPTYDFSLFFLTLFSLCPLAMWALVCAPVSFLPLYSLASAWSTSEAFGNYLPQSDVGMACETT